MTPSRTLPSPDVARTRLCALVLAALTLFTAGAAAASTFQVTATAEISGVTAGHEQLLTDLGASVGSTITYSAIIDTANAIVSGSSSQRYANVFQSLTIGIGAETYTLAPPLPAFPYDVTSVGVGNDTSGIDFVQADANIGGAAMGDIAPWAASLRLEDLTQATLDDQTLDAGLFSSQFLANALASGGDAHLQLYWFDTATGAADVRIDAQLTSLSAAPIAAVPLPAGGLLLLAGTALLTIFRRRRLT